MLKNWRAQLSTRLGEQVFQAAAQDFADGNISRKSSTFILANVISALVIASPLILVVVGILLVRFDFPNLLTLIIGSALILVAIALCPRFPQMPDQVFDRSDLPALFELLDHVTEHLKIKPIEKVALFADFNASANKVGYRRTPIIGIGLTLWQASTPRERIALIAHELAHLANDDPGRSLIIGNALSTLKGWRYYLTPQLHVDENGMYAAQVDGLAELIMEIFLGSLQVVIDALEFSIVRLFFLSQQRAEYLADALSADIAGATATTSLLEKITLTPLLGKELLGYHPIGKPDGTKLINRLAGVVANASETDRGQLLNLALNTSLSVDQTHPATVYRVAFLELFKNKSPAIKAEDINFTAIDAEIAPHLDRIGLDFADQYAVQ